MKSGVDCVRLQLLWADDRLEVVFSARRWSAVQIKHKITELWGISSCLSAFRDTSTVCWINLWDRLKRWILDQRITIGRHLLELTFGSDCPFYDTKTETSRWMNWFDLAHNTNCSAGSDSGTNKDDTPNLPWWNSTLGSSASLPKSRPPFPFSPRDKREVKLRVLTTASQIWHSWFSQIRSFDIWPTVCRLKGFHGVFLHISAQEIISSSYYFFFFFFVALCPKIKGSEGQTWHQKLSLRHQTYKRWSCELDASQINEILWIIFSLGRTEGGRLF